MRRLSRDSLWTLGGERADDLGATADFLVESLFYPALVVGQAHRRWGGSAVESSEVIGEGVGDAGGFAVPAAGLCVGVQVLDVR